MTAKRPWVGIRSQVGKLSERRKAYSLLVQASELPDPPWGLVFQHRWRIGAVAARSSEEARRVFPLGRFAAVRAFTQNHVRDLGINVVQLASADDARSFLPKMFEPDRLSLPKHQLAPVGQRSLPKPREVELSDPLMWELETTGIGSRMTVIVGRVNHVAIMVSVLVRSEQASSDDVVLLASLQARKVRQQLDGAT